MLLQQGGRSLAEELSLFLRGACCFLVAPCSCTGKSWAPALILQAFFLLPAQPALSEGAAQWELSHAERFSLEAAASFPPAPPCLAGRRPVPPVLGSAEGKLGGEVSGGALPSPAPHVFSSPEATGRSETHWHRIRDKGLVRGSALPLKCCPWRFGSCSRLLVHQLFNSLQPCGLQPRVLISSECTSLCVGGAGLGRGYGAGAGQRTPAGKQCRGTGDRSCQPKH